MAVKLLFDENLSPKLVRLLVKEFPDSNHVELLKLRGSTDTTLWELAKQQGYMIVSKDNDFRQRAFLLGAPPKVIWLSIGNSGTTEIVELLKQKEATIQSFEKNDEESLLVLELERNNVKTT
jgi:predicted nuclease of predicted toxin-antitoxin system